MKKTFFYVALLVATLTACDYSVNSNGNIDEAYAHEAPIEVASTHTSPHTTPAHHETVTEPAHTNSTAIADSTHADTTAHKVEAHH